MSKRMLGAFLLTLKVRQGRAHPHAFLLLSGFSSVPELRPGITVEVQPRI